MAIGHVTPVLLKQGAYDLVSGLEVCLLSPQTFDAVWVTTGHPSMTPAKLSFFQGSSFMLFYVSFVYIYGGLQDSEEIARATVSLRPIVLVPTLLYFIVMGLGPSHAWWYFAFVDPLLTYQMYRKLVLAKKAE